MFKSQLEVITPKIAVAILNNETKCNRKLSDKVVKRYTEAMQRGVWDEANGETIKIARDGALLDGQHRLWALIEADVSLKFLVVRGLSRESFKTIDVGKTRTTGDVIGVTGIASSNQLAAGAAVVVAYKHGVISTTTRQVSSVIARDEVVQFALENTILQDSLSALNHGNVKLIGSGPLIALHYLFTMTQKGDREKADVFFKQLGTGLFDDNFDLAVHPIRALRDRMMFNKNSLTKLPVGMVIALIIKTWNYWVSDSPTITLRLRREEAFPKIVGESS